RVLVEWLADMVDQLATDARAETTLPRSLDQLTQKARAIARFVSLWCQGERGSAVQLAAVERFTWPLPTTAVDPCELMKAILSRHREPVRRMINMRLDRAIARRVDASDIAQEVLLEASRRLRDYLRQPNMPFHLWLRHIARDHLIDAHRRHRVAKRRTVDRERPIQAGSTDQSSVELIAELIDRRLTPATAALRTESQTTS